MNVISLEKRLRKVEAASSTSSRYLKAMTDAELVTEFRRALGPDATEADEGFIAFFETGEVVPGFDPGDYAARLIR